MFYSAESIPQRELSRQAAERYARLEGARERRAQAKEKKKARRRVRLEVVKAA